MNGNWELYLTPGGSLQAVPRAGGDEWRTFFAAGNGAGFVEMLACGIESAATESFLWIQEFVRDVVTAYLRVGDGAPPTEWLPAEEELAAHLARCPGMTGMEYLNLELLQRWCRELFAALVEAAGDEDLTLYLARLNPIWAQVGKVAFHLAENKDPADQAHPFLFLATYVHRISLHDKPKHLPLAKVLAQYAQDRAVLLRALTPLRSAAGECPFLKTLLDSERIWNACALTASEAHDFLRESPVYERAGIAVRVVNLWKKSPRRLQMAVNLTAAGEGAQTPMRLGVHALVRFNIAASLGGDPISQAELDRLMASAGKLVRFKGEWVEVDSERLRKLLDRWHQAEALLERSGIPLVQGLRLLAGMEAGSPRLALDKEERKWCRFNAVGELRDWLEEGVPPESYEIPEEFTRLLRPYQVEGVRFLLQATARGFGVCLADDMGLGKTLQMLVYLDLLRRNGALRREPALLVVPASLLHNWRLECAKFTPELRFGILHNSQADPAAKAELAADARAYLRSFDVVATTYQQLMRLPELTRIEFACAILDEAQLIKNPDSQQSRTVRGLKAPRRIALSGTPVENQLGDLWSIFDFILPGLLGSRKEFSAWTASLVDKAGRMDFAPVRRLVRPYILRRLKTDRSIIADLPEKTELKCYCRLTPKQAALYQATVTAMLAELNAVDDGGRKGVILKRLGQFKQICNHPAQFDGTGDYDFAQGGKFARLEELASVIAERREKLLVFTQFREMTEPLHEFLSRCFGRSGLILHGGTPVKERARLVEQFQSPGGAPFFVLSLKAAGTGLNLTSANHVIHFDRWWNPAVENQATDRAFRIGQRRNCLVHKMICRGTIEEKIDAMIEDKRATALELFAGDSGPLLTQMSNDELLNLVKLEESEDV